MSTVLAMSKALARETRRFLPGAVYGYHGADLDEVPLLRVASEGPAQLHRFVELVQPDVLVLDVQLGGNAYRALDAVRLLLDGPLLDGAGRLTRWPAVVVLAPSHADKLVAHCARLGCYSVL